MQRSAATGLVDAVSRARALGPLIADASPRIEAAGEVTADVVQALHRERLFRLLLPKSLGGEELDPATYANVIEIIAEVDASTAWCLGQGSGCAMAAAYLDAEAAGDVFGDADAVLAWGPGPAQAIAIQGGYRVTGRWSFASGCHHATWLGGHAPVFMPDGAPVRDSNGRQIERTMLFPRSATRIEPAWDVIGLRGTGSDAFAVEDLFVPHTHSIRRDVDEERRLSSPLYQFKTNNIYAASFASVALGIARAMLGAFKELVQHKVPRGMAHAQRDSAVVQLQFGEAEAKLRAARSFLQQSLREIWEEVCATGTITLAQRVTIRMAATHAIQRAVEVADFAYHTAGATAIFASNAFERRFRDIHAVAQQVQGRQAHFETVGRHLLGLDIDAQWL